MKEWVRIVNAKRGVYEVTAYNGRFRRVDLKFSVSGKSKVAVRKAMSEEIDENSLVSLEKVKDELLELLGKARKFIEGTDEKDKGKSYWYADIKRILTNEHKDMKGDISTMEDAITELIIHDLETSKDEVSIIEIEEYIVIRRKKKAVLTAQAV